MYNHPDGVKSNFGETLSSQKYPVIIVCDLVKRKTHLIDIQKLKQDGHIDDNGKL